MLQPQEPRLFKGVTISSTFTDLKEHRLAVIDALQKQGLHPVAMEHDTARADLDMIGSLLQFIRDGAAYIGIISHKYGQPPRCPKRNRDGLSITELEFNEALRLSRPILLFIMSDDHAVPPAEVENNVNKKKQLKAFRDRAKKWDACGDVNRVYSVFSSLDEFKTEAIHAVAKLKLLLESAPSPEPKANAAPDKPSSKRDRLPRPPAFCAVPRYASSHAFVGRAAELAALSAWAAPSDPKPMFLLEAIGGSGKSLLAWQWINYHALEVRSDWAGRFWYSFYEKGAVMAQFCREALAYMTGEPMEALRKLKILDLGDKLIEELTARPWLVVMDGLERVLVAYHRYNAHQLRDDEVEGAEDQIAKRDPCAAIDTEDDELLRRLADVAPSKLVVTSRLMPLALLNRSHQPLPGVRRQTLLGLRPEDAEEMFRACGVTGESEGMRAYLQQNCGCHPLVIGALAGLVNNYLPDRGNFDRWAIDPNFGSRLDLAKLDLRQRQNHILEAAFDALPPASRQLLSTLSLLSGGADYETLSAFNPHLPKPGRNKKQLAKPSRQLKASSQSEALRRAPSLLQETVRDLETRGLLQYDTIEKRYDLHPVVRGVTFGRIASDEKQTLGQRVVDYFSLQPHRPYEQAETLEDVAVGLQLMRGFLQLGRFEDAVDTFLGSLSRALMLNLNAASEVLSLLSPLFPRGFRSPPVRLTGSRPVALIQILAGALGEKNLYEEGLAA